VGAAGRDSTRRSSHHGRPAGADLGAARDRDPNFHISLVRRRTGARVGAALRASACASWGRRRTAHRPASGTRAHLGSTRWDRARRADRPGRSDMGRRTACSATGAGSGSVVGTIGPRRPARADVGFACARAIVFSAAAGAFLGGSAAAPAPVRTTPAAWQRPRARVGKPAGGSLVGRTRGPVCARGRACSRVGGAGPVVGLPGLSGSRRSASGGPVVECACRPCVGRAQERGARRTGCPVVVGARRPTAAPATAASSDISAAAGSPRMVAAGRRRAGRAASHSALVAAGRARRPAQVPRAADRGAGRGNRGLASRLCGSATAPAPAVAGAGTVDAAPSARASGPAHP
jgi:hypothetical protein